ncbi:MAG: hypothetical protein WD772_00390 [Pseudohongiellaceae bacterium]
MIVRLVALVALLMLVYWGLNSIARKYSLNQRQAYSLLFLGIFLTVVIVMIILGRLPIHFIIAPLGVAATFLLRMLPTLLRLLPLWQIMRSKMSFHRANSAASSANQASRIRTAFLAMELRHGSGDMDGTVLQGKHQGKQLSTLNLAQLLDLAGELAGEYDSVQILEAYLDRMHPAWRESSGRSESTESAVDETAMTRVLALEILGLSEPVTREQAVHAHRKLMQKLHPDRGGSDYLAKKINSARDYLESIL